MGVGGLGNGSKDLRGLSRSLTTSFSPKGCSIAAIAKNDCGLICRLIVPEPCCGTRRRLKGCKRKRDVILSIREFYDLNEK